MSSCIRRGPAGDALSEVKCVQGRVAEAGYALVPKTLAAAVEKGAK